MQRQPVVQTLEQLCAGIAIVELKIQRLVATIGRPQHVDLALTTALQCNRIQLAACGGFDIQRDQFQVGTVIGRWLDLRVAEHAIGIRRAAKLHRRGDEALHQVAFGRANVRFVDVNIASAQQLFDVHQLAVLLAIHTQHRAVTEITEFQRTQLYATLGAQQRSGSLTLLGRNKGDRGLARQADMARALIGGQPEVDLGPGGRIFPVPTQDEALLNIQRCYLVRPVKQMILLGYEAKGAPGRRISGTLKARIIDSSYSRDPYLLLARFCPLDDSVVVPAMHYSHPGPDHGEPHENRRPATEIERPAEPASAYHRA